MAKEVHVTGEEFLKLKNPYTGLPIRTIMVVTGTGDPLFHADPSEYATSDEQETAQRCYDLWNRVNGVGGMKNGQQIRCAYTGETLTIVHTATGVRYDGGFNPHMLYRREEYLYRASMRGGVSKYPDPNKIKPDRVTQVKRTEIPESRKLKDRGSDMDGEAVDRAAAAMQEHKGLFKSQTTVHISKQKGAPKK